MATGRVKSFLDDKGYGFITPDDGSGNVFVHFSALPGDGHRTLEVGQLVDFDAEETPRGPRATRVAPVGTPTERWAA